MTKHALVCIAEGSEELESVTIIDVLRRGQVQVTVAKVSHDDISSSSSDLNIVASRGVKLVADVHLDEVIDQEFDAIILPGGMGGAKMFSESSKLLAKLDKQKKSNKIVAALCAR